MAAPRRSTQERRQQRGRNVAFSLFVTSGRSTVTRIDPATNRVIETAAVGSGPFVVPDHPSELWVASFRGKDVWRLRPR